MALAESASVFCGAFCASAPCYCGAENVAVLAIIVPELKFRDVGQRQRARLSRLRMRLRGVRRDGTLSARPRRFLRLRHFGTSAFSALLLARIKDLPGLKFGKAQKQEPMHFVFEGGEGIVMPLRREYSTHIVLPGGSL